MRTTVNLDPEVLAILKARAARADKTLGEIIGDLTRQSIVRESEVKYDIDDFPVVQRRRPGHVLTLEDVERILEEEEW